LSGCHRTYLCFQDIVPKFLDKLTDEELKKESKTEAKNDALSSIIKALKQLVSRLPNQEETIKSLEIFRLKMILRLVALTATVRVFTFTHTFGDTPEPPLAYTSALYNL
jgi:ubiquitin carboxyl-terminal hydrolase 9/24